MISNHPVHWFYIMLSILQIAGTFSKLLGHFSNCWTLCKLLGHLQIVGHFAKCPISHIAHSVPFKYPSIHEFLYQESGLLIFHLAASSTNGRSEQMLSGGGGHILGGPIFRSNFKVIQSIE